MCVVLFSFAVQRDVSGELLQTKTCLPCANGNTPNEQKTACVPCQIPNCTCSSSTHELLDADVCAPKSELTSLPDEQGIYMVDFDNVHQIIRSHYLKVHLRSSRLLGNYGCLSRSRGIWLFYNSRLWETGSVQFIHGLVRSTYNAKRLTPSYPFTCNASPTVVWRRRLVFYTDSLAGIQVVRSIRVPP